MPSRVAGSGQFVGSIVGVYVSGWIVHLFGWQWTFILFGAHWGVPVDSALVRVETRDTPVGRTHGSTSCELRFIQGVSAATRHAGEKEQEPLSRDGNEAGKCSVVMLTRNGVGVVLTFLTFGYVLFTLPSPGFHIHVRNVQTLHREELLSWTSLVHLFYGFIGFLISGPINDWLVAKFGHAKGRKLGAGVPMGMMIVMMLAALETSKLGLVVPTVVLIGLSLMVMNASVGAWGVNAVDLAPSPRSSAFVYGVYNGVLNLMGAYSSILVTMLAHSFGFIAAFASAVVFMGIFLVGLIFVIDEKGLQCSTTPCAFSAAS